MRVVEALRFHPTLTQAGISRETGLSRTTVSTVVKELKGRAIVEATMSTPSGARGGRPGERLRLRRGASSADLRLVDGPFDDRINQIVRQNTALTTENARLSSLVASIKELMGGRDVTPS
jgi:DNA-binding transcriptional regulator LsrR (DeoR family)